VFSAALWAGLATFGFLGVFYSGGLEGLFFVMGLLYNGIIETYDMSYFRVSSSRHNLKIS
jgi:hypothetical protein